MPTLNPRGQLSYCLFAHNQSKELNDLNTSLHSVFFEVECRHVYGYSFNAVLKNDCGYLKADIPDIFMMLVITNKLMGRVYMSS